MAVVSGQRSEVDYHRRNTEPEHKPAKGASPTPMIQLFWGEILREEVHECFIVFINVFIVCHVYPSYSVFITFTCRPCFWRGKRMKMHV